MAGWIVYNPGTNLELSFKRRKNCNMYGFSHLNDDFQIQSPWRQQQNYSSGFCVETAQVMDGLDEDKFLSKYW